MSATDKVAKIISDLTKQISSKTRAAQLGNSSVRILTGDELLIGDAVETATDTSADLGPLMDYTEGVSDIADGDANNLTLVPEWLVGVGDTGDLAFSVAAEAGERVTVALEEADKAAQDAANALTTANGKNARRRGKNQPEPPTGGWAQGDQWIRDDENGKPVEVLVWSGTTFVSEQLLASELLVIGANGTVQIKDGLITAPKLAVDALDFKVARGLEIQGGKFTGGEFVLGNVTSTQEVYSDSCSSVARWWGRFQSQTQTTEVQLSPISQSGTSVTNIATAGLKYIPTTVNSGSDFEAWVRVTAEQEVFVRIGGYQVSIGVVPANTWKKISLKFVEAAAQNITIYGTDPFGSLIYVDDIKLTKQVVQNNSGARLYRDGSGKAILETISANTRTRLIDGAVQIDNPASPSSARISLSSFGLSSNDSVSRITINKDSDSIGTGIDLFAGQGSRINLNGGKASGNIEVSAATTINMLSNTMFHGGVNSHQTLAELNQWTTPPSGTEAWVEAEKCKFVRSGGKWLRDPSQYFNAGDTYSLGAAGLTDQYPMSGVVSGASKDIYVTIPLHKAIPAGVTPVLKIARANARAGNGGYWSLGNYTGGGYDIAPYLLGARTAGENVLLLMFRNTTAWWATNNMAVSIDFSWLKVDFV